MNDPRTCSVCDEPRPCPHGHTTIQEKSEDFGDALRALGRVVGDELIKAPWGIVFTYAIIVIVTVVVWLVVR